MSFALQILLKGYVCIAERLLFGDFSRRYVLRRRAFSVQRFMISAVCRPMAARVMFLDMFS